MFQFIDPMHVLKRKVEQYAIFKNRETVCLILKVYGNVRLRKVVVLFYTYITQYMCDDKK